MRIKYPVYASIWVWLEHIRESKARPRPKLEKGRAVEGGGKLKGETKKSQEITVIKDLKITAKREGG